MTHTPTSQATHICIARHGETDWNKRGILQGWLDVPVNAKGRLQAVELAQSLVNAGFSAPAQPQFPQLSTGRCRQADRRDLRAGLVDVRMAAIIKAVHLRE